MWNIIFFYFAYILQNKRVLYCFYTDNDVYCIQKVDYVIKI